MKVKGSTAKMVVVDLERKGDNDYEASELGEYAFNTEDAMLLPRMVKIYANRIELVCSVEAPEKKHRKVLKVYFNDAILMNRVLHKICGRKK